MSVLTTCVCNHPLTQHGEHGPMLCLEDDCGCEGFVVMATYEKVSNEPCRVCGEIVTAGGKPCKRCEANMEEDRMRREIGA